MPNTDSEQLPRFERRASPAAPAMPPPPPSAEPDAGEPTVLDTPDTSDHVPFTIRLKPRHAQWLRDRAEAHGLSAENQLLHLTQLAWQNDEWRIAKGAQPLA